MNSKCNVTVAVAIILLTAAMRLPASGQGQGWKVFYKDKQRVCSYDGSGIEYPYKKASGDRKKKGDVTDRDRLTVPVKVVFNEEGREYEEQWEIYCMKREVRTGLSNPADKTALSRLPLFPDINNLFERLCDRGKN